MVSHLHHNPHSFCHCPGEAGPGGAPRYCRLGLPPNATAGSAAGGSSTEQGGTGPGDGSTGSGAAQQQGQEQQEQQGADVAGAAAEQGADAVVMAAALQRQAPPAEHRMAVLIPYRDRQAHLEALLAALRPFLDRQGRAHDVFVVEQARSWLAGWLRQRSASVAFLFYLSNSRTGPKRLHGGQPSLDATPHATAPPSAALIWGSPR